MAYIGQLCKEINTKIALLRKNDMMSSIVIIMLLLVFVGCAEGQSGEGGYKDGTYEVVGLNYNGPLNLKVEIKNGRIESINPSEGAFSKIRYYLSQFCSIRRSIIDSQSTEVDAVSGATYISEAVKDAVDEALEQASGKREILSLEDSVHFTPGIYTAEGKGYHGKIKVEVKFSKNAITGIKILDQHETEHIGDVAYQYIIPHIIKANGTGVDGVTGATATSFGVKDAVNKAAMKAGLDNRRRFFNSTCEAEKHSPIKDTWDIVIIGGGGAGMSAAAQAASDGNSVLVIEKNAEVGGNTVVSGGYYQSVDHHLVWDVTAPNAKSAIGFDGKMHEKVKATTGCVNDLKVILGWNEKPFDTSWYESHPFVIGDIQELSKHGVHQEYLPVLLKLKQQIRSYLAYAEPQLARGIPETSLTLFSTTELHIFQTYYGGLRQSADGREWTYGDLDLVSQFIAEGEQLKPWLMNMGVQFVENQVTLVGALWYRGNVMKGCETDADGDGTKEFYPGNWGSYVMAPMTMALRADSHNKVMRLTSANELIVKNGRVCGVKAMVSDGTQVTAYARKGVIIATGGYAANIQKVIETNNYWKSEYLSGRLGTTNRSSMQGDGIRMAESLEADVIGEGWTQLLPLAYASDGSIAMGGVESAVFVSPKSAERYVDECTERDVLSLAAFQNGIDNDGVKGVFLYITRGFGVGYAGMGPFEGNIQGKEWGYKGAELDKAIKSMGLNTDVKTLKDNIMAYDKAVMEGHQLEDVGKAHPIATIGDVKLKSDGSYDKSTYSLDSADLRIRLLAPAAHHTIGGLRVDLQRRVLNKHGQPIPGLYAAGEVTGGFFGGNRLGGNALTEVMASGRIAAKAAGQ